MKAPARWPNNIDSVYTIRHKIWGVASELAFDWDDDNRRLQSRPYPHRDLDRARRQDSCRDGLHRASPFEATLGRVVGTWQV